VSTSFQKGELAQACGQPDVAAAASRKRTDDIQPEQAAGEPLKRTEIMVKQIEEKIRQELEENLKSQQLEAERILHERE